MALPASDPFSGSGALADPPWSSPRGGSLVLTQSGGRVDAVATNSDCPAFWDGDAFSNDQYSQGTAVGGGSTGAEYIYLFARFSGTWAAGAWYWFWSDGHSDSSLHYVPSGSGSEVVIATDNALSFTTGDVFKLECVGTAIKVYKNGVVVLSATDSHVTTGVPGLGLFCNFHTTGWDAFAADNVAGAAPTVQKSELGTTRNRPGRGPMSKGRFKVPRVDEGISGGALYVGASDSGTATESTSATGDTVASTAETTTAAETSSSTVTVFTQISDVGDTRNKPGRGPFSVGRFFVPHFDEGITTPDFFAVLGEMLAAADTSSETTADTATAAEAATAVETASSALAATASAAESGTAVETSSESLAASASVAESATAVETSSTAGASAATIAEALTAAETSSSAGSALASIAESVTAAETASCVVSVAPSISETLSAVETSSAALAAAAAQVETLAAAETSDGLPAGAYSAFRAESFAAVDAPSCAFASAQSVAEAANASETVSGALSGSFSAVQAESAVPVDVVASAGSFSAQQIEVGSVADISAVAAAFIASMVEAVSITNTTNAVNGVPTFYYGNLDRLQIAARSMLVRISPRPMKCRIDPRR